MYNSDIECEFVALESASEQLFDYGVLALEASKYDKDLPMVHAIGNYIDEDYNASLGMEGIFDKIKDGIITVWKWIKSILNKFFNWFTDSDEKIKKEEEELKKLLDDSKNLLGKAARSSLNIQKKAEDVKDSSVKLDNDLDFCLFYSQIMELSFTLWPASEKKSLDSVIKDINSIASDNGYKSVGEHKSLSETTYGLLFKSAMSEARVIITEIGNGFSLNASVKNDYDTTDNVKDNDKVKNIDMVKYIEIHKKRRELLKKVKENKSSSDKLNNVVFVEFKKAEADQDKSKISELNKVTKAASANVKSMTKNTSNVIQMNSRLLDKVKKLDNDINGTQS